MEGVDVVAMVLTGSAAAEYLRFRLLKMLAEADGPLAGRELLRGLASEYRPADGSAGCDAELELLAALGAPVEAVAAEDRALRWCWDPRPDDPHWLAVRMFWPAVCERASRGWRRRDAAAIAEMVSVLCGEMEVER